MLKKLLDLLSDAAVYGISSMLSRIVGLALLPLLTRYLTPTDYGVVIMLGVVGMLFVPLGNLGMTNAIFRRFNLEKDPQARASVLGTGLVSVTCSSLAMLAIGMLVAGPIARFIIGDASAVALVRVSLLAAAATAIEARIRRPDRIQETSRAVQSALGSEFYVNDLIRMNSTFFAALRLEKLAMTIAIGLIAKQAPGEADATTLPSRACPRCGRRTLFRQEDCDTCTACGYSKCD